MRHNTLQQGRIAEAEAVTYFVESGYDVFLPMYGNTECDLIVMKDGKTKRVQVKSTVNMQDSGKYRVELKSTRSNRNGNTIKKFDASLCDILVVHFPEEDAIALYKAQVFDGKQAVHLFPLGEPEEFED